MKTIIYSIIIVSALFFSCDGSNTEEKIKETAKGVAGKADSETDDNEGKTGTFSFDGKEVSAVVATQYFGDKEKGNFSVLCQHNESDDLSNPNFELLQVTFVNEKDAIGHPSLKIYPNGSSLPMTEPEPGIVAVSLSGVGNGLTSSAFTGNEKSSGSIVVKDRVIEITNLVLFNTNGEKKTITANLPF